MFKKEKLYNDDVHHSFLHFMVSEIRPAQILKGEGHYSKVKQRSHHDFANLNPQTDVATGYYL